MKHDWFYFKDDKFRCCRNCGIMENKFNTNRLCKGKVKVELREREVVGKKPKDWIWRQREPKSEGSKICKSCGKNKSLTDFAINRSTSDGRRSTCKTCKSYHETTKQILKKAEKFPGRYLMCNVCDRIFCKDVGRRRTDSSFKVVTACKFCGSKDIEPY